MLGKPRRQRRNDRLSGNVFVAAFDGRVRSTSSLNQLCDGNAVLVASHSCDFFAAIRRIAERWDKLDRVRFYLGKEDEADGRFQFEEQLGNDACPKDDNVFFKSACDAINAIAFYSGDLY